VEKCVWEWERERVGGRELFVVVVQTKTRAVCSVARGLRKTIHEQLSDADRLTDEWRPVRYDGGGNDDGRCRRVAFRSVVGDGGGGSCTAAVQRYCYAVKIRTKTDAHTHEHPEQRSYGYTNINKIATITVWNQTK